MQLRLVADFSRWLTQQGRTVYETTPEHTNHYLRYRAQRQRPRDGDAAALERLLALLRHAGARTEAVPIAQTPAQQFTDEFGLDWRQERARASPTVTYSLEFVRPFSLRPFRWWTRGTCCARCGGRSRVCAAPGGRPPSQAGETHDDCAALLPPIRALSGRPDP